MKAVVLAAGQGRRIGASEKGKPKPLIRLLGLPLIVRSIFTLREAGIRDIIVVTGFKGDMIKEHLGDGRRFGVKISYADNPEWERGNAVSLLKARKFAGERFILVMSDHVFSPEIIKRLSHKRIQRGEAVLAVDKKPNEYVDMEDATKVLIEGDRIVSIGKDLRKYNGVDCGAFLLTADIFSTIEDTLSDGKDTLNDVMDKVAKKGSLRAYDIGGEFWIDVDTEDALKTAERLLLKSLIKPTDGFVSRVLNRPLSTRITRWLVNTELTPNVLSIISFIICIVSAALFSIGSYLSFLVGGLLAQFTSVLDGCDGEVARLKFQSSSYGAWLDSVLDRYGDAAIVLGIVYGLWSYTGEPRVWLVGYIALMGSLISSYTATKYDEIVKKTRRSNWRFGRDTRLFLVMICAILNELYLLLVLIGIITNLVSIRRLYVMRTSS